MNEILKIVLSLSLSSSLLFLVLLLCKPLIKNRISKRWQYYIWLVVVARLLLPFTPETSFVGTLFQEIDLNVIVQSGAASPTGQGIAPAPQLENGTAIDGDSTTQGGESAKSATPPPLAVLPYILQNLWLVWLVVALILLIRKMTIYQGFVRYIKAGRAEVSDTAILDRLAIIGEQAGVKIPVELYANSLIASPLLLGFFRPCIVLPTADLPDSDFEYTILHELTHYKRRDMFYKWLVQLTICLHWFNPIAYLLGREVSRACELACDEAVIRKLDTKRQLDYGDTLLSAIVTGGDYRDSLASMTLNESKELLKERLEAIMKFKNPSIFVKISTAFLTVAIIFGATFTGAYAAIPDRIAATESTIEAGAVVLNLSSDGQNSIHHSSSFEAKANQTLVLDIQSSITGGTVDFFLFSPTGQERRITIGGSDKTETVTLTAGRWAYNCTGFFESGAVTIKGHLSVLEKNQEKYDVKLDKIGVNQVVCIGQINLNKDVAYRVDITADSGDGLFVGLQSSSQITSLKGVAFDQRYGTASHTINTKFKSGESESYYVYVGNEGDTTLTEVSGLLYVDKEYPANQQIPSTTTQTDTINISSNGQQNIIKSGSFEAEDKQLLTLTIQSDIIGGIIDFFLFSPTGQERRITIGGSDKTETVTLTAGRWAYNCTGFFESGAVTIKGQLSVLEENAESQPAQLSPATASRTGAADRKSIPTDYVVSVESENVIVKQGGTKFKLEVDPVSQNNYIIRDNINVSMGERNYRFNKWDIVVERKKELGTSAVFSSTVTLTIPENLERPALYLQTTSGDIHIENLHNVNLAVESESGTVYGTDTSTDYISAESDKGNIKLTNFTSTGDIELRSDTGSVAVQLGNSDRSYAVKVNTAPTAGIVIDGKKYAGGDYMIGGGGKQTMTLNGQNNSFSLSNVRFSQEGAVYWTEADFTRFMQEQVQAYKKLLTSGEITQMEYDIFVNADKEALKGIQNGDKVPKSATGSIANSIGTDNKYDQYKKFGLIYNTDKERFYYNGKLVRYFEDIYLGKRMTIAGYKDGEIDVHTLSDENGMITGVEVYDQAGFDENTKKLADPMAQFDGDRTDTSASRTTSRADAKALDIMQRTGNWGYIEAYLPEMTNAGIDAVVNSYNSKHPNSTEHKKASNYYN